MSARGSHLKYARYANYSPLKSELNLMRVRGRDERGCGLLSLVGITLIYPTYV